MKKIFLYVIVSCCLLSNGFALTPSQEHDFSLEQYRIQLSYTRKQELIDHAQNRLVASIHRLNHSDIDYSEKKFRLDLALKKIKIDQHKNLLSRNADLLDLQKRVLIADHLDPEIQPQYIQAKQIYDSSKKQLRFHKVKLNLFAVDGKRTQIQQNPPMTPQATDSINPPSTIKIGYRGGRGVGYHHSYSSAFLFLTPSWDRKFQPFFDLRTHVFNDGRFASNFGGGLRFISDNEDCVLGINAYHDFRSSHDLHTHQMGLGLEGLFPYFDVRVNGYLPVAKYTKIEPIVFHRFTGNIIEVTRLVRRAYPTVNAEFGVPIPGNFCRKASLYLGVGPYYLFGDKIQEANFKHSYGVKGRITAKFFDMLGLEFVISHDHVYHRRVQGAVTFQIPLGRKKTAQRSCSAKEAMLARAQAPPERNEIIPIKKKQEFFPHTDANGRVLNFIFVNNTAGCPGSGTFESPFCSLAITQAGTSSANDIIYVFRGDGTTNNYNTGFNIQQGQRFQGSGQSFLFHGVLVPAMSSGNPNISNLGNEVITMASNSTIDGFNIAYSGGNGIGNAVGASTLNIINNSFSGSGATGFGVEILASGAVNISVNSFSGVSTVSGQIVVSHLATSGTFTITNNTHTNYPGGNGFAISVADTVGGRSNVTSNTMNSTAGTPAANDILIATAPGSVVTATNNNMTSNAEFNIFTLTSGGDVTLSNNSIVREGSSATANHSISVILAGATNITVTENTIVSFVPSVAFDGINIATSATPTTGIHVSKNNLANVPSTNGISLRGNAGSTYCVKMKDNASITFPTSPIQFTLDANGGIINFQAAHPSNLQADNDQPSTNTFVYTPVSPPNANLVFGQSCSEP